MPIPLILTIFFFLNETVDQTNLNPNVLLFHLTNYNFSSVLKVEATMSTL